MWLGGVCLVDIVQSWVWSVAASHLVVAVSQSPTEPPSLVVVWVPGCWLAAGCTACSPPPPPPSLLAAVLGKDCTHSSFWTFNGFLFREVCLCIWSGNEWGFVSFWKVHSYTSFHSNEKLRWRGESELSVVLRTSLSPWFLPFLSFPSPTSSGLFWQSFAFALLIFICVSLYILYINGVVCTSSYRWGSKLGS